MVPMYRCRPFEVYKVGPAGVDLFEEQKINTPMYDIVEFIFDIQWRASLSIFWISKNTKREDAHRGAYVELDKGGSRRDPPNTPGNL
jgi:hypothetical protein